MEVRGQSWFSFHCVGAKDETQVISQHSSKHFYSPSHLANTKKPSVCIQGTMCLWVLFSMTLVSWQNPREESLQGKAP